MKFKIVILVATQHSKTKISLQNTFHILKCAVTVLTLYLPQQKENKKNTKCIY